MDIRNEKSSFCIDVILTDRDGEPLSPITSVSWWVGKPGSDDLIIEKQEIVNPTSDIEIVVPAEASICTGKRNEKRFLIVRVQSGSEHVKHSRYEWEIKAMDTVPYPSPLPIV